MLSKFFDSGEEKMIEIGTVIKIIKGKDIPEVVISPVTNSKFIKLGIKAEEYMDEKGVVIKMEGDLIYIHLFNRETKVSFDGLSPTNSGLIVHKNSIEVIDSDPHQSFLLAHDTQLMLIKGDESFVNGIVDTIFEKSETDYIGVFEVHKRRIYRRSVTLE